MKVLVASFALLTGLTLPCTASAQSTVSTYKNVKLCVAADQSKSGKPGKVDGTLNLDPDSKNVLFVVNESVKKTIPYGKISALEFYMADHLLRIEYRDGSGASTYVDMNLPDGTQPTLLKEIQAETGIAIHLT
ncbi:MAG TPA: hypothetical protein VME68_07490 [Acidobacteriaceae bacterium]|nr:hypothetical protein [Acidobacteriaceae bacterium]